MKKILEQKNNKTEAIGNKSSGFHSDPVFETGDRRSFLKKSTLAVLGLGAMQVESFSDVTPSGTGNSQAARTPVIDMHLHCFAGPNDPRFPYHERATYKPAGIASPEHLLVCMNGAGVDHAVVVSPEPYQDDHRYLEYCLDVGKGRLKGTILVFADRPGSMDQLPRLAKRGDIIATRIHAYLPDRLPPFGKPELRQLWKLASDNGLAIQLHFEPQYAAGFEPLIKEFKNTPVIIDHLGRPLQARSPEEYAIVERWGDLPNTIIKISSLGTNYDRPDPKLKQYVNQMITAYGLERMIYGGGFDENATPESYRATIEYTRSYIAKFSEVDQANVLGGNASRLLCRGW
jgi:predicted TIM-barrel fold metal-dependent hydrolase